MTPLVPIALFGWIPLILLLFTMMPPRRAAVAAFIAGWCFLPMYGYPLAGMPDYNKQNATCVGILLATLVFDGQRFARFKPRALDIPILLWCISPFISNTVGGFGPYEGFSTTLRRLFEWGIPYFIGRLYFTDLKAMRELAIGLFIGGLIYMPLCLYEVKMSPQLHKMVYGFFQDDWLMTVRGGGWRPTLFMQHGLAVGLFMSTTALIGVWMWKCKSLRAVMGVPMPILALLLLVTAVLCKSTGAISLMAIGLLCLFITATLKVGLAMRILIMVPVLYIVSRTILGWRGDELLELASMVSTDRSGSLNWRLISENECWRRTQPQALFGFGRFIFAGIRLENAAITPDGLWLIALVSNGLFGLTMLFAAMLLPSLALVRRVKPMYWGHPAVAPAAAVAVIVVLYAIDNLFNAMTNPIFILGAGGLVSTVPSIPDPRRARAPAGRAPRSRPAAQQRPARPPGSVVHGSEPRGAT